MMLNNKEIIKLYNAGLSSVKIAKNLNVPIHKITYILSKEKVKMRSNKENYKINCNHLYFSKIDTEAKAYFVGLITADGSIIQKYQASFVLQLVFQEADSDILYNFAKEIECEESRIKKYFNGTTYYKRILLPSDIIAKDLQKHNIIPNKTYLTKFSQNIPYKLKNHYIRGIFDGDGCITVGPSIKITGTEELLLEIQKELITNCRLNKTKLQKRHKNRNNNIRSLEYGGKQQILRIKDYLYNNATIYFKRKWDKFNDIS